MATLKERLSEEHKAQQDMWKEMSQRHWSHWRAWGSWFSWGSPVGLGLFFVLLAITFAIVKYAINL